MFCSKSRVEELRSVAYGLVILIRMLAATLSASAQTLTVLYAFTGTPDGSYPIAPVIRDAAGNLYGSTFEGGTDGFGTVFKLSKGGNETLYLVSTTAQAEGFRLSP